MSIIFIEKSFETYDGLIANIYSVRSKVKIDEKDLKCKNLKKLNSETNIVNKEYKFSDDRVWYQSSSNVTFIPIEGNADYFFYDVIAPNLGFRLLDKKEIEFKFWIGLKI